MKQARLRKTNIVWSLLCVKSKNVRRTESDTRTRSAKLLGWGKWGNVDQKVQTFSYKMNTFGIQCALLQL